MLVSRLTGPGRSAVVREDDPVPGPGQVLVRVRACGVCASELPDWRSGSFGPLPLGHEVAGEVAALGPAAADPGAAGPAAAGPGAAGPGAAGPGAAGPGAAGPAALDAGAGGVRPGDPVTGLVYGGLAQYALADATDLVPLPPGLPFPYALGEPLGCVLHALDRVPPPAGHRVALVGLGFLGLTCLAVLAARRPGELVAVSGRAPARALATDLGATAAVPADRLDPRDLVAVPGPDRLEDGYDLVVEATGRQDGLDLAGRLVRPHGTLLVLGWHRDGPRTVDLALWNWKAITVVNGHVRRRAEHVAAIRRGVELLRDGTVSLAPLVTRRLRLDQVDEGFRALTDRAAGDVKSVVEPF